MYLPQASYRNSFWKNGKGKTAEIAIFPQVASKDDPFLWRLSSAQVTENGPFSSFPGYNRYLTLLEGPGLANQLALKVGDRTEFVLSSQEVFQFSGDDPAACRIVGGPVKDLNLIFRRGQVQAELRIVQSRTFLDEFSEGLAGRANLIFCMGQTVHIAGQKLEFSDTLYLLRGVDYPDHSDGNKSFSQTSKVTSKQCNSTEITSSKIAWITLDW